MSIDRLSALEVIDHFIDEDLKSFWQFKYFKFSVEEGGGYIFIKGRDLLVPKSYVRNGSYVFNSYLLVRMNATNFYKLAKENRTMLLQQLKLQVETNPEVRKYFNSLR